MNQREQADKLGIAEVIDDMNAAAKEISARSFGDCKYSCEVQIVIGPDGKPTPTLVCGIKC